MEGVRGAAASSAIERLAGAGPAANWPPSRSRQVSRSRECRLRRGRFRAHRSMRSASVRAPSSATCPAAAPCFVACFAGYAREGRSPGPAGRAGQAKHVLPALDSIAAALAGTKQGPAQSGDCNACRSRACAEGCPRASTSQSGDYNARRSRACAEVCTRASTSQSCDCSAR